MSILEKRLVMSPRDWLSPRKNVPGSRRTWNRRPRRNRVRQSCVGDWLLEDRLLLAGLVMPGDTVPAGTKVSGVLYDGGLVTPNSSTQQYVKHITITNNSTTQTIYPFLEDANSRTATSGDPAPAPTYTGTGMFDPFDPLNQEYRGYIGYTPAGQWSNRHLHGPAARARDHHQCARWSSGMPAASSSRPTVPTCWETGANGNPFLYRDQSTQVTYFGSVSGNTLTFTPVYNSFAFNSTNNDYEPSAAIWQPPTNLTTGMNVNGPGIPANTTITVGSDPALHHPEPAVGHLDYDASGGINSSHLPARTPISSSLRYTQTRLHRHGRTFQRQQRRGHVVPLADGREPQQ